MSVVSVGALVLFAAAGAFALALIAGVAWVGWKVLKGVFYLVRHVLRFVGREVGDTVHTVGAVVTGAAMIPLVLVNAVILRFGASRHYARAIGDELKSVGVGLWRIAFGNPLRLVGLGSAVDRIERRIPDVVERVPRHRRARRATFEGYDVIGTLPSGGSGAQLFVARPRTATSRRFFGAGRAIPPEVVIKSFALEAGSTLPQIVRESRALEAASRLGLVLEHQLTDGHFYYVMPYVKGEDLDRVVRGLHALSSPEGLRDHEQKLVLGYAMDILDTLERFHSGGLWHKDVKPANVIVSKGRAHLVDFGLVTPLASAMTLTTHGTEYYRDPEMVRLALQGVKVHEVDGVRFDIYSAGAVLYSMIENSFPAHGSLSKIAKRCPEALRWIVQRAMAEMSARYGTAREMREDLAALAAAQDPFALRPADLPSFQKPLAGAEPVAGPAGATGAAPAFAPPSPPRAMHEPFAGRAAAASTADAPQRWRPRRRHGLVPVTLAASGLFGLFFLTSAAFLVGSRARHAAAQRVHYEPRFVRTLPNERWSRWIRPEDQKAIELAQGVVEDLGSEEVPSPRAASELGTGSTIATASEGAVAASESPEKAIAASAQEILAAATADPAPAETAPEKAPALRGAGRVLVLDDLATGVDARAVALLRKKLAERGFSLVGEETDETEAAAAVELIAGARNTIGLGRLDESETQAALQRYLDQSEGLDAIVLVSRSEDESSHLFRVLMRAKTAADGGLRTSK